VVVKHFFHLQTLNSYFSSSAWVESRIDLLLLVLVGIPIDLSLLAVEELQIGLSRHAVVESLNGHELHVEEASLIYLWLYVAVVCEKCCDHERRMGCGHAVE
jgi:predicted nucleotidyltransferase